MKNFIILLGVAIVTGLLGCAEFFMKCPFEWHMSEIIGGIFLLAMGLLWNFRVYFSFRKLLFPLLGGILLIVAVNVATNALFLLRMLFESCPDMSGGMLLILTFLIAIYVPFIYIGAIWLYLYRFCDLRDMFMRLKQDI